MMKMELPGPRGLAAVLLVLVLVWRPSPELDPALAGQAALAAADASPSGREVAALDGKFAAALVMDADTGQVLAARNPRVRRQPASMVKMMTELIVLERVAEGDLTLADPVTVSAHASKMGGSQVYLRHGEVFSVEELLMALAIHSANDAAVALAEHVAGSVLAFIDLMNARARRLGMADTEFHSVHGLPPGRRQEPDLATAHDLALLGRALMRHPEAALWASTGTAPFRDGEFTLYNPNRLIGKFRGLDGVKTGFHDRAGYCVTASAVQKGKRLISVVMGAPSDKARATETTRLLSFGFSLYTQVTLVEQEYLPLSGKLAVKGGKSREVPVAYAGPLSVSVPRDRVAEVVLEPKLPEKIPAPVQAGLVVGQGQALLDGHVLGEVPIVALEGVPKGSWLDRLFH